MSTQLKTSRYSFCAFAGDSTDSPLFSVNAGVPVESALASASCLLEIAQKILMAGADGEGLDATQITAALVIIDQSKASIDAAWSGVQKAENLAVSSLEEQLDKAG